MRSKFFTEGDRCVESAAADGGESRSAHGHAGSEGTWIMYRSIRLVYHSVMFGRDHGPTGLLL